MPGRNPAPGKHRMRVLRVAGVALALAVSAPLPSEAALDQCGVASWYGPGFQGRPTASGEAFNQNLLTAAHRTLPFGTVVLVERTDGGGSVRVRINDRGPYVGGRVIDLSRAAAQQIDMIGPGVAAVRLTVVSGDATLPGGCG